MASHARAAVLEAASQPLVIKDIPIPETPPEGLLVKTLYAGVCHSDLHFQDDVTKVHEDGTIERFTDNPLYIFPKIPGHEVCGVVCDIGPNCTGDVSVGERVLVHSWMGCTDTDCRTCRSESDMEHWCPRTVHNIGFIRHGGFASHVAVPSGHFVVKCPESIPSPVACLLPCSALTAYTAVSRAMPLVEAIHRATGESCVAVIGAGGLGLWAIQFLKVIFPVATTVMSLDLSTEKLETAKEHGADETVLCSRDRDDADIMAEIAMKGHGGGVDGVIDFVGNDTTGSQGIRSLNKYGVHVTVGLYSGHVTLALPDVTIRSITMTGVLVGTLASLREIVQLVAEKKVKPPPINEHTLEEVNDVMDALREGKVCGRAVIKHE